GPAPSGPLGISRTGVGEAEGLRNLAIAVKAALSTGRARQAADDAPGQDPLPSEADTSARHSALFANTFVSEPTISEPDNAATHIDPLFGTQASFTARLGAEPMSLASVSSPVNSHFDLREPEAGRLIMVSDLTRPQREGVPPPTRRELMPSPEA